jgi:hypothetical protein
MQHFIDHFLVHPPVLLLLLKKAPSFAAVDKQKFFVCHQQARRETMPKEKGTANMHTLF